MQQAEPRGLSCQSFVELVTDYLERALPAESEAACAAHLAGCGSCSAYLDQMRRAILLIGKLVDDSVEPATRDELLRRFRTLEGG